MRHARPYESKDIDKSFSATIRERGRDYYKLGWVLDASYTQDGDLAATVRSGSGEEYEVKVRFEFHGSYTKLESSCSCPYSKQCKHAVAAALFALHRPIRDESNGKNSQGPQNSAPSQFPAFDEGLTRFKPVAASNGIPVPRAMLEWFELIKESTAVEKPPDQPLKQRVSYFLQVLSIGGAAVPVIEAVTHNLLKSGGLGASNDIKTATVRVATKPVYWTKVDADLLSDMEALCAKPYVERATYRIDGRHGEAILRECLATGRCLLAGIRPLRAGEPVQGTFEWQDSEATGEVTPTLRVGPRTVILQLARPWYVEPETGECGPIESDLPVHLASLMLRVGKVSPEFIPTVKSQLTKLGLPKSALPRDARRVVVRSPLPVPTLRVDFEACQGHARVWSKAPQTVAPVAFANLTFEYEGVEVSGDGGDIRILTEDKVIILRRSPQTERQARDLLVAAGWQGTRYCGWEIPDNRTSMLCIVPTDNLKLLEPMEKVNAFAAAVAPKLIAAGWKVEVDENIRYVPDSKIEWDVSIDSGSGVDWFEFQLGIRVEGEAFDLRSILNQVFQDNTKEQLLAGATEVGRADAVFVFGLGGRAIKLSRKRLLTIVQPLVEIFGGPTEWPEDLRLPKSLIPEATKFGEKMIAAKVPWKTNDELQLLSKRFANFDRLEPVPEPKGFAGELRPYQREGLAWLQFLREFNFGGVLADDMGLGKTVQILAHIQCEKVSGRMDRPCLIVAPTSTMPNWRRESERFAPDLKVVTLQGSDRASRFETVRKADIVLTTYPLLARDKETLLKSAYHLVVLDEAQNVKNSVTAASKAARDLNARHRICLSGTPVENHLGELWSLFHFLMPGFLGADADFKKNFRTPIEKNGDKEARERLARRIRPFMLRRTKSQVVKELPAKTEIIESIEFDDAQRDLYESIRIAMDEKIRALLASQGLDKSRIQILDALLKLRQVCCDPRLVKLPSAKSVSESAKLNRLMEMLKVLVEDGRKVLLFSQFTSMLDLIEERLRGDGITWVRISGDTKDRETPVKRFQAGEVPLFLISLKAGGTGLNLTAADTVVLYDPWWNPAVENQAIDRAHRIGQQKAVIVYKLVASGTIEEKMLEIQARKGDIAKSILTDDAEGIRALSADDLRWVLSS